MGAQVTGGQGFLPSLPASWLPRPVAWLLLQLNVLLLGLNSLLCNLLVLPLVVLLPRQTGLKFGRWAISRFYRFGFGLLQASGLIRIDAHSLRTLRHERGLVVAVNHPCFMDAVLIVSHLPHSACIMKANVLRNPFLGSGALLARYTTNASAHRMVRSAVADIRAGGVLVIFPEGTRTTQWPVGEFKPSFSLIAKHAQAPVQTVFIETDSPYLTKGWPIFKLPPVPMRYTLRLGRRFEPQADHQALAREVQAYFREEMSAPSAAPSSDFTG